MAIKIKKEEGETKMTILVARLTASLITYGVVAICGAIGIWGAL